MSWDDNKSISSGYNVVGIVEPSEQGKSAHLQSALGPAGYSSGVGVGGGGGGIRSRKSSRFVNYYNTLNTKKL